MISRIIYEDEYAYDLDLNQQEEYSPSSFYTRHEYPLAMIDRTFSPSSSCKTPDASSRIYGLKDFNPADYQYEILYDTFE